MATLRAAPTRHCHTEQFSGILTDQYLPGPYLKKEGGMGETKEQTSTQTASYYKTLCEELQASNWVYKVLRCPC